MRRIDRQITKSEAFSIMGKGEYGVLSTVGSDNQPYGVPLNYCLTNDSIYFHSAQEGRKIENIINNPKVSFCVIGKTEVQPNEFSTKFESCIVQGFVKETFAEEKQFALEGLVKKYSKQFIAEGLTYIGTEQRKTRVFKITIESFSGKAKK